VLARVVVGFQRLITHGAIGEGFVPAEQIRVRDSGDRRADQRCQPEHPELGGAPLALKNATPVDRAGLTDVLEIGMEMSGSG